MAEFHSAVNRIPVLRTSAGRDADQGRLPAALFTDHSGAGHDHLHPERWSGSIDLRLTAMTPLVFGEQKEPENGRDEPSTVSLPRGEDGSVVVPPTMIKGMLSRAYETLTASRFRVFEGHGDRLTYRADAAEALRLVPIRVTGERDDGDLDAELLLGEEEWHRYVQGRRLPIMRAAALQAEDSGHADLKLKGGVRRLRAMTAHGKKLTCDLELCLHRSRRYTYWQVTHIAPAGGQLEEAFRIKSDVTVLDRYRDVTGYVYRTARDEENPRRLFPKKHDERFFFSVDVNPPVPVVIPRDVAEGYRVIANGYRDQRKEEEKRGGKRSTPNRVTVVAQEGGKAGHPGLKPGDLAYARLADSDYEDGAVVHLRHTPTVCEVVPTMIGRRAYSVSPYDLAEEQKVLPAASREQASAAERLFGYVVPDPSKGAVGGDVALRGRLTFGPVDTSGVEVSEKPQLLAPLLSPKTTSARRFLTDHGGATPTGPDQQALPRSSYYSRGQLLGTAAYPVHRMLLDRPGFPKEATDVHVPSGVDKPKDSVRLRAASWIMTGSVMSCTVQFTDLLGEELAALLWLLNPENLVPAADREPGQAGYLRMGLGKPLGLGVVKVEIADGGVRATTGQEIARQYEDLEGCLGAVPSADALPILSERVVSHLDKIPWVKAMQRAAYGYTDSVPVRHMWLEENKENNMTHDGHPRDGAGVSPHPLMEDEPRPISIRVSQQDRGHGWRQNNYRRR
ncbi:TIGR03986 family type III CRISPR-associated RAMP protein [Actinomyces bowdenii]|uniref:TIGR03986 family CRISPR-associated RAMP protein n=1 Tax=Actinomyces bowdenii TaxID=131109 RepID=A0A3P1UXQ6_9ACTO|nr:TIGR03986 family CRISPR-associated RAMP protein [Actinomyces bowdenii]RRD26207.1 TIGR03986 family CRISPR-associated RAMP protein [Actinomyces bowdenii]